MKQATLLFLVKRSEGAIANVCLAMKKRGFGMGRWNGVGGKVHENEGLEDAARREAKEEIGITAGALTKVAELSFTFPHEPSWNQVVHAYITESWEGMPIESDEMRPRWFKISDIPFNTMWPDDVFWLPHVLDDARIKARFTFGEGDVIHSKDVQLIDCFL